MRLEQLKPQDVILCSIVKAELLYGAQKSRIRERMITGLTHFFEGFVSLPFDDRTAEAYGTIRADLERQGTPIGPNDLLIAAIALANGAILVTHNSREFSRVAGLKDRRLGVSAAYSVLGLRSGAFDPVAGSARSAGTL